jgi:hypothetical protein
MPGKIYRVSKDRPLILYKVVDRRMGDTITYQIIYRLNSEYTCEFNSEEYTDRIYALTGYQDNNGEGWDGLRVFIAEAWGKVMNEGDKIRVEHLKLIKEIDPAEVPGLMNSEWAYYYCRNVRDIKSVRDRITQPYFAYLYCKEVKDRKEVRDRITDSKWAYYYCEEVKDRKEIRDKIINSEHICFR